jgi:HK97 gp10 family phage protein
MMEAKVTGIPDLKDALRTLVPKLRVRALLNALRAGAKPVRDNARAGAPVLSMSSPAALKGRRTPGLLKSRIVYRKSKLAARAGDVGVYINVRPAKKTQRGGKNPQDPFYWRWVEFGAKHMPGKKFLQRSSSVLPAALGIFIAKIGPAIAKLNKPKAPAP